MSSSLPVSSALIVSSIQRIEPLTVKAAKLAAYGVAIP